jgi:hypothetical protein
MDAERLREIAAELAELIAEGEAIVFSREGYSLRQIERLHAENERLTREVEEARRG